MRVKVNTAILLYPFLSWSKSCEGAFSLFFFLPGLSLEPSATAIGASGSSVALLCISNPDSTWDRACFWIGSRCSEIDRSPYDLCLYRLPPAAYTSTFKYQRVLLILRLFSPNNAHIQGELLIFWYCFFGRLAVADKKDPTISHDHFPRLSWNILAVFRTLRSVSEAELT